MHPWVDKPKSSPTGAKSPSIEIDYGRATARPLLKESTMRITTKALLCSLTSLLATACAPIGERGDDNDGPDAGTDGGSASTVCDNYEQRSLDLTISGDAGFTGLPTKCWKLNGRLTLTGPAVTSLAKLGDLREVSDLVIDGTALTKLDTKAALQVSGDITIKNNNSLTDIANLSLTPYVDSIVVEYNQALTSLGGLSKAGIITGATSIRNNAKLATVALGSVTRFEGGLTISDNAALKSLDLKALVSIGNFVIKNNGALTSIGSMPALEYIHGSLTIDNNDALTTLDNTMMAGSTWADRKVQVDFAVSVTNNAALTEIGAVAHFTRIGGSATITGNGQLTFCEAREVDCCVNVSSGLIDANKTTSCNTSGYSWCNQELGYCPY
jgi:hypothetical protein